ncbi:MAG: hypothetical protein H6641_02370 [Caldilineaceae bacterium]|nr:hypothetical protein [Caldilineaceae bacterium]
MFEQRTSGLFWSIGLVVSGIVLLLFNFDILAAFEPMAQYLLAAVAALAGVIFLGAFASAPEHWWRLIPGWTLLALASMIFLSTLPNLDQRLTAALLFLGLALAFVHIYLLNRNERWWAIIPGGFMLILGIVIALSGVIVRIETLGALLFTGMGAVFFVLYGLGGRRRQWWALIPGSVLLIFGLFVFARNGADAGGQSAVMQWWPLILLLLGVIIGLRTRKQQPTRPQIVVNTAPSRSRHRAAPQREENGSSGTLGEYSQPAPGASVEVISDVD